MYFAMIFMVKNMGKNVSKRGFTLVELLVVVFILGLLVVIAVPSITSISNRIKTRGLDSKIEAIEDAAIVYVQENSNQFKKKYGGVCKSPSKNCECEKNLGDGKYDDCKFVFTLTVDELISQNQYKSETPNEPKKCDVSDPRDSSKCLDCVPITVKLDDDYKSVTAKLDEKDIKDNKAICP